MNDNQDYKQDANKVPLQLMPPKAIVDICWVFHKGLEKYPREFSWRGNVSRRRIAGAALRHIFKWLAGQEYDEESGLSHWAHVGACAAMAMDIGEEDE